MDPGSFAYSDGDYLLDEILDFEIENNPVAHRLDSSIASTLVGLDNVSRLRNRNNISQPARYNNSLVRIRMERQPKTFTTIVHLYFIKLDAIGTGVTLAVGINSLVSLVSPRILLRDIKHHVTKDSHLLYG